MGICSFALLENVHCLLSNFEQVVQSGSKNVELAILRRNAPLEVSFVCFHLLFFLCLFN